ncbi:hypothetical protein D3C71_1257280 [compost metagenome]
MKVTESDSASLNWRGWQVSAAKGSGAPTVALAPKAGLPSPAAAAGAAAGACVAEETAGAWTGAAPCLSLPPIHQPTPMAPANTTTPATASQVLLTFPLTANPSAYSNTTLLCGGAADLLLRALPHTRNLPCLAQHNAAFEGGVFILGIKRVPSHIAAGADAPAHTVLPGQCG